MKTAHLMVSALVVLGTCAAAAERVQFDPPPKAAAADSPEPAFESAPLTMQPEELDAGVQPVTPGVQKAAFQSTPETPLADEVAAGEELCQTEIVDARVALKPSCLNVIVDIERRGNRINASTREKHELRSLCDSMWLPRCRHKY